MRIGQQRYTIDYGHLALITLIAAAVFWYLLDARSVSLSVNNLLLVQPVALFALAMYLFIIPQCFHRVDKETSKSPKEKDPLAPTIPSERSDIIRMATLGAALGLLVFLLDVIGFDIGIFLFTAAAMAVCGERRPLHLIGFSLAVTLVGVYGFRALIPFPMHTTIL